MQKTLRRILFFFYVARLIPIEANRPSPLGCIAWPRIFALMRMRRKTLPQTPLDEILETQKGAINPRQELKTSDRVLAASVVRVDLERMVDQMPSGYRKAFFLHDNEDYSHPEIAEITGWSIGTSKSQLHRARKRLRKLLECGHRDACRASMRGSVRAAKKSRLGETTAAKTQGDRHRRKNGMLT